ncbi:hypothetical protein [Pseudomonas quasicaspiana]|uniref:hypothetical protein n=1 Tax=Pseudomonas quasicaspiana TaxID=2829821 RepID=UPI001E3F3D59|nr:hypothetical protein [Pseudomonas quasicaspiana]MCD5972079.1 hypothetical protein [Pseudomonas quasicaspiana]
MDRKQGGCDFEGTGLSLPIATLTQWGSCDNRLGYSSAAQWNSHFISQEQIAYKQCSWNADNAQGWRNMIESRHTFSGSFSGQQGWNEIMQNAYASESWNALMLGWVTAFFYDVNKSGGLSDAKVFQQKMANTGKRVPILRLDFAANAVNRFQYVVSDQVAYP